MFVSDTLINWYNQHKRDLPWRNTKDPYRIWLSEIILQQTRVDQGTPYYLHFINKYPNVKSLALASEDEVMRSWQGLGYYSRARNLHAAAKQVINNYSGKFPQSYSEIITLKGVGEYTAAAIASFAFKEVKPVLDGNVYRFISRYYGITEPINSNKARKIYIEVAESIIDNNSPDIFNQAIMEFGALQCKPQSPDCSKCPLNHTCYAYKNKMVSELPVKLKKLKRRERFFNYLLLRGDMGFPIIKRTGKDIWQSLYELPLIETSSEVDLEELVNTPFWKSAFENRKVHISEKGGLIKHVLTHQDIFARFWIIEDSLFYKHNRHKYVFIKDEEAMNFAFPKLIEQYLGK